MEEFNTNPDELYSLWKDYLTLKLKGEKRIVSLLKKENRIYNNKLDYYTTLGLELFSSEFLKISEEEKKESKQTIQKEFDFGE